MNQNKQILDAAAVNEKFKNTLVKFDHILAQGKHIELSAIRKKLREDLKAYHQEGILSLAFVGQYNAGKSTTISAITGRRDIRIDSDIATDKTASYAWNSIKIIDTPGLFTDRKDHDEITYDAINKADLLVFCLTYMLFDSVTVANFKKLAYEKAYRFKMMLIVNKMSDEAGEEAQKIANYRQSLKEAIKPHSLDEFPVCFIDAKDYCEGVDQNDDFLIEISRFQTFLDELNKFVKNRSVLARFDTPIRIALSCVDEAQLICTRDDNQDSAFLEVLTRLSRTVRKERERLRIKVNNIALQMSVAIAKEGTILAAAVGSEQDFTMLNKQTEINVKQHYEKAETQLQDVINTAVEDIRQEVEEFLQGNLVQTFITCLEKRQSISADSVNSDMDLERIKSQINWLKDIGEKAGVEVSNFAKRELLSTASSSGGFLRSMDVAGSGLHQTVLAVGKFVGFDFKPWQAVGIAKNIGNAAMFLGPAVALISLATDAYTAQQEQQREKQMADVRSDITSQFQAIAKDLENQIESQLREFEQQVYGEIEQQIATARQKEESAIAASNTWVKQLLEVRKDFDLILRYITKATVHTAKAH
ncbi:MAG: 50S ribosome-binding GTPase [Mojavia pulchra JT2-VF2]|jgi:GTP-binding protein EngB required for normal cell division|uniref:50S ribosome-binding GTPase n=1 Tax=Mojavia pulchra JT2-VF2 TaxID=287848 RepID=A0A951UJG1_9NOST|nr:50S ribosome-binding GTPase [Mojavia pulchra JT2-VF2]